MARENDGNDDDAKDHDDDDIDVEYVILFIKAILRHMIVTM